MNLFSDWSQWQLIALGALGALSIVALASLQRRGFFTFLAQAIGMMAGILLVDPYLLLRPHDDRYRTWFYRYGRFKMKVLPWYWPRFYRGEYASRPRESDSTMGNKP